MIPLIMEYEISEVVVKHIKNQFKPFLNIGDRICYQRDPGLPDPASSCLITHLDLYYQYELKEDHQMTNRFYYEIQGLNCHNNV
ncbi:hypothetical protein SAMN04488522_10299 [Pedobacter caeni]|uniref:Uncharacterized protein n=1 Tax=Pedobacter caeni TaxID=288992 RepID=A0A1M4YXG5_9SPHI|nr:hypothetical protein SAMN04488522_10299 [Pedobacter caeni]